MNIGLDIDGTITEMPEFFALLSKVMRQAGHKIFIISYRDMEVLDASRAEVNSLGVEYDAMYHPGPHESLEDFKARMASQLELDMIFDDMPESFMKMHPNVKRFWLVDPKIYNMRSILNVLQSGILNY